MRKWFEVNFDRTLEGDRFGNFPRTTEIEVKVIVEFSVQPVGLVEVFPNSGLGRIKLCEAVHSMPEEDANPAARVFCACLKLSHCSMMHVGVTVVEVAKLNYRKGSACYTGAHCWSASGVQSVLQIERTAVGEVAYSAVSLSYLAIFVILAWSSKALLRVFRGVIQGGRGSPIAVVGSRLILAWTRTYKSSYHCSAYTTIPTIVRTFLFRFSLNIPVSLRTIWA